MSFPFTFYLTYSEQRMIPLTRNEEPPVIRLKGSPFEMGYEHGRLLKDKIRQNIENHLKNPLLSEDAKKKTAAFIPRIPTILPLIPGKYLTEMRGVSEGAGVSFDDILLLNLFPEMFHCCAITACGKASVDGSLYHTRLLDYAVGKDLQSSAVLIVAKPEGAVPFLSVSYAGFIGCITAMNGEKISVGEIGGMGYGKWDGMPMSFLMRELAEKTRNLPEAKELLQNTKRTCEYYYIIGDGKTNQSFGCYATADQLQFLYPGTNYSITPSDSPEKDHLFNANPPTVLEESTLFFNQPEDTLLLTGVIEPERYPVLEERMAKHYGSIEENLLMEIMKRPVSRSSNLHNAIFHPSSLRIWVAHAGSLGPEAEPACDQPYKCYDLGELLKRDESELDKRLSLTAP